MQQRKKECKTTLHDIFIDDDDILWLIPSSEIELDMEEAKACFECYRKMGVSEDSKVLQIIDARVGLNITREAREYAAIEGKKYFIACAVISESLSVRLIVNFINAFYKGDGVPLKIFSNGEEAKAWLKNFK